MRRRRLIHTSLTVLCVATMIAESGAIVGGTRADWLLVAGVEAWKAGRVSAADRAFRRAALMSPRDAYLSHCAGMARVYGSPLRTYSARLFARGISQSVRCKVGCGEEEFDLAVRQEPGFDAAYHNLGWLRMASGDRRGAVEWLERAVEWAPFDPTYRISLGMALYELNLKDRAIGEYARALVERPSLVYSDFWRDLETRDRAASLAAIVRAEGILRTRPNDPIYQSRLAKLLLREGNSEQARVLAESAKQSLPNLGAAWLVLGDIAMSAGEVEKARTYYKRSLFLDKTPEAIVGLAYLAGAKAPAHRRMLASRLAHASSHARRVAATHKPAAVLWNDLVPVDLLDYIAPYNKADARYRHVVR